MRGGWRGRRRLELKVLFALCSKRRGPPPLTLFCIDRTSRSKGGFVIDPIFSSYGHETSETSAETESPLEAEHVRGGVIPQLWRIGNRCGQTARGLPLTVEGAADRAH